jgi:hypothetical protein
VGYAAGVESKAYLILSLDSRSSNVLHSWHVRGDDIEDTLYTPLSVSGIRNQ